MHIFLYQTNCNKTLIIVTLVPLYVCQAQSVAHQTVMLEFSVDTVLKHKIENALLWIELKDYKTRTEKTFSL